MCIRHSVVVAETSIARELVELAVLPAMVLIGIGTTHVQVLPQIARTQPEALKTLHPKRHRLLPHDVDVRVRSVAILLSDMAYRVIGYL